MDNSLMELLRGVEEGTLGVRAALNRIDRPELLERDKNRGTDRRGRPARQVTIAKDGAIKGLTLDSLIRALEEREGILADADNATIVDHVRLAELNLIVQAAQTLTETDTLPDPIRGETRVRLQGNRVGYRVTPEVIPAEASAARRAERIPAIRTRAPQSPPNCDPDPTPHDWTEWHPEPLDPAPVRPKQSAAMAHRVAKRNRRDYGRKLARIIADRKRLKLEKPGTVYEVRVDCYGLPSWSPLSDSPRSGCLRARNYPRAADLPRKYIIGLVASKVMSAESAFALLSR